MAGDRHKTERVLGQVEALPALAPATVKVLWWASRDQDRSAQHLALATQLLQVFAEPKTLRRGAADGTAFNRTAFWTHCLAVACAARQAAMRLGGGLDPEEAFVCGLLHDLGKAALDTGLPKSYARVVRQAESERADLLNVEMAVLGVDHTIAGRHVAERWSLPPRIVECIWLHHQPADALPASVSASRHVQIVQFADALAREQRIGHSGNPRIDVGSRQWADRLGLSAAAVQDILATLSADFTDRAPWLGLHAPAERAEGRQATPTAPSLEQNRRLCFAEASLSAIHRLNEAASNFTTLRETCTAAGEQLRIALDVQGVVVFAWRGNGATDGGEPPMWDVGGHAKSGTLKETIVSIVDVAAAKREAELAVRMTDAGVRVLPLPRLFDPLADRYGSILGDCGAAWLLPLQYRGRWTGGAMFRAEPEHVAAWLADGEVLKTVIAAAGSTIGQARERANARNSADELAAAHRRFAADQTDAANVKTFESIVHLAAGAAHELNTPLAVISGRAQMCLSQAVDEPTRAALRAIVEQAHACSDIISDLMEFARPDPPSPDNIDIRQLLEEVISEMADSGVLRPEDVAVELENEAATVRFDREQLRRTFREILANSAAATLPEARRLTVKARVELAEKLVTIEVLDNGTGMTTEVLERAMDPFFSFRPAGRGRGLGLARANRWVRENGGTLRIESRPGEGTRVRLKVPLAEVD